MKVQSNNPGGAGEAARLAYRTVKIEGLDIFYREAGPRDGNVMLLLHGFPTSSHMFRNLITALADEFHLVAPDYPATETARCRPWASLSTPSIISRR